MMEIQGFSPLQQELADRIWCMESMEEIVDWVQTLPRSVAVQAWIVIQMVILESLDSFPLDDLTEASEVIDYIRSLPC
jgi:hypothetical protein